MTITKAHWNSGFGVQAPEVVPTIHMERITQWRSNVWMSIHEVIEVMQDTCPEYNGFNVETLNHYAEDLQDLEFQIAREGSVCLYARGKVNMGHITVLHHGLSVDELDHDNTGFRAWWD